jgi:transcriptional antiterminator RfaH
MARVFVVRRLTNHLWTQNRKQSHALLREQPQQVRVKNCQPMTGKTGQPSERQSIEQHNRNQQALWYAIYTKAKEEERAGSNLRAWGVKTFLPRIREFRFNEHSGRPTSFLKHLFPRYIFARFDAGSLLHKVNFTRGVCKVVSFGNGPSPVDEILIDTIKSQISAEGFVRSDDKFNDGDSVMVKAGLFRSLEGTVERDLKDCDRLVILLSSVSYQGRLMIEKALVKKVARLGDWVNA